MKFTKYYSKLHWTIFTTIRKNTGKYRLGNVYVMDTQHHIDKFKARVVGIYPIKKEEITDRLANIDAETTKEALIKMLEHWYGKDFDDYMLITLWAQ